MISFKLTYTLKSKKQNNQLTITEIFTISNDSKHIEKIKNEIHNLLSKYKVHITIKKEYHKIMIFIVIFEK